MTLKESYRAIISGVEPEQMEDPGNPQHPEDDKAGQEEKWQDRQEVYDTVKGN